MIFLKPAIHGIIRLEDVSFLSPRVIPSHKSGCFTIVSKLLAQLRKTGAEHKIYLFVYVSSSINGFRRYAYQ